jgi:hypothetical protein
MLSRLLEFLPVSSGYTTAKVFPWPVKLKTVLNPPETAGGLDWSLEVKSFPFDESEPNYDSRVNAGRPRNHDSEATVDHSQWDTGLFGAIHRRFALCIRRQISASREQ